MVLAVAMCAMMWLPVAYATQQRLALVIGNNAYSDGVLKNPINDARAMATTLRELGFEVRVLENADRMAMQRGIVEFGRKLNENTVGLFYFAGHGMQVRGANYLIPVKAEITSEDEVEVEGLDVAYVMARMATAKNQFNIVILDACRNNPFQRSFRSTSNGLAAISAPTGTLIAYATAPGSVASDGDSANGIYTSELARAIRQPGISMEEAFKNARSGVIQRTQGKQTPWESSSVVGNFKFKDAPKQQVASLAAPAASASRDDTAEIAFWNSVKDSRDPRDFQAYIDSYPNGVFDRLARVRIAALTDAGKKATTPAPVAQSRTPTAEAKKDSTVVASLTPAPATTQLPAAFVDAGNVEGTFRQNWGAVEAILKEHVKKEYNFYRYMIPAFGLGLDVKLDKATLVDVIDPGNSRIKVELEGMMLHSTWSGGNMPNWRPYRVQFAYNIKFVDGKPVIGDYQYLSPAPVSISPAQ
ncbi:MAG: caspase family protein [Ferrovibrio sp.]